jgi:hypothetical protein
MNSCALIIPTCRHILPTGRRCLQPAVRRRSCCRHHLDTQARLHNMARARRCSVIPRLRVPETLSDLAWNQMEMNRLLATERLDFGTAKTMLWALDLQANLLRAEAACRAHQCQSRASNSNGIYEVPSVSLFSGSLSETLSQVTQNTWGGGRGVHAQQAKGEERTAMSDSVPHL